MDRTIHFTFRAMLGLMILLFYFPSGTLRAQKIDHIVFAVFGSSVVINYDLEETSPGDSCTIEVYLSSSSSDTYKLIPSQELKGNVGTGVRLGKGRSIHWHPSHNIDYPAACFKLKAKYSKKVEPSEKSIEDKSMEMVYVEGGTFKMGSNDYDWTKPIHSVTVSSFYIGKYEVTQKQWADIMGNNPAWLNKCETCPVDLVRWTNIEEFIEKLYAKTGKHYRLPTEAEWDFAARGGVKSKGYIYAGSDKIGNVAWYKSNSRNKTHPVGTKDANELGIFDMTGNVWEWCSDWRGKFTTENQINPQGASDGVVRVFCGGGYDDIAEDSRIVNHLSSKPIYGYRNLGFRLVYVP